MSWFFCYSDFTWNYLTSLKSLNLKNFRETDLQRIVVDFTKFLQKGKIAEISTLCLCSAICNFSKADFFSNLFRERHLFPARLQNKSLSMKGQKSNGLMTFDTVWKIYSHWKNISSNQLFSENIAFMKLLSKKCKSKFS